MSQDTPKRNAFFGMLIVFVLMLVFFSYKKHNDYKKLNSVFAQDVKEMENELNELIHDYKGLEVKRKGLSKRLIREMNKIIALRDSIKTLTKDKYVLISKYRKRIRRLERENRDLFVKVDSLNVINSYLKENNNSIKKMLASKSTENNTLQERNLRLRVKHRKIKAKIKIASIIKISSVKSIAMKERSSGKLTSTSRSSRADAFKTTFRLLENKVTTPGVKKIYIQILDQNNTVISSKGKTRTRANKEIEYSDQLTVNYVNNPVDILSLVLVDRNNINRGYYTIKAYVDGYLSGETKVKLR